MATVNEVRANRAFEVIADAYGLFVTQLSTNIVNKLTGGSPRDTSWMRSNYFPALNTPYRGPGERPESESAAVSAASSARADQANRAADVQRRFKPGHTVWVSNTVPYLRDVDESGSSNEPGKFKVSAGFLKRLTNEAVDDAHYSFRKVAREINRVDTSKSIPAIKNIPF